MKPLVSILIPHYKTLNLTKFCLRSLRRYTNMQQVRLIVIDNDSRDNSINYLKSLKYITFIQRKSISGETPSAAHGRALDLGLKYVDTPYVLSIHTDTIVYRDGWLDLLFDYIREDQSIAGVGSWKIEKKKIVKEVFKPLQDFLQYKIKYPLLGKHHKMPEGVGSNYYYLRSHCALYRTDLVKELTNGFCDGQRAVGRVLHKKLSDHGFGMVFIPPQILVNYVRHLTHATMALNAEFKVSHKLSPFKHYRHAFRVKQELKSLGYEDMIADDTLDRV